MKRLTMSLDDGLAEAFDALVRSRGYQNRSEAFRDLLRQDLGNARLRDHPDEPCVATLSYVYNHHQRPLLSLHLAGRDASGDDLPARGHEHLGPVTAAAAAQGKPAKQAQQTKQTKRTKARRPHG